MMQINPFPAYYANLISFVDPLRGIFSYEGTFSTLLNALKVKLQNLAKSPDFPCLFCSLLTAIINQLPLILNT